MIKLSLPPFEPELINELLLFNLGPEFFRGKKFTKEAESYLSEMHPKAYIRLTKSCTQALELTALLLDIKPGDEVILPSFAYVSIATSFVLRGATLRYVDIDPLTLNISPSSIEAAISPKTRAIIVINYAGIACDYENIWRITEGRGLVLVEDNAMGLYSFHNGQPLGTFGDISTISFDYLKNVSCGEGGAILINNNLTNNDLDLIYENGTNKLDFIKGKAQKYEWQTLGSNYHISEFLSAVLVTQLKKVAYITATRKRFWNYYYHAFAHLEKAGLVELLQIPHYANHNGHSFIIKTKDIKQRNSLMNFLKENGIESGFHYSPLHLSPYGKKSGVFIGLDRYTTNESNRILRLPLHTRLTTEDLDKVIDLTTSYLKR